MTNYIPRYIYFIKPVGMTKLRTMLATHAAEWRAFLSAQGDQSFLKTWMDGGRHGRSE